jgi:hypothetical protein
VTCIAQVSRQSCGYAARTTWAGWGAFIRQSRQRRAVEPAWSASLRWWLATGKRETAKSDKNHKVHEEY